MFLSRWKLTTSWMWRRSRPQGIDTRSVSKICTLGNCRNRNSRYYWVACAEQLATGGGRRCFRWRCSVWLLPSSLLQLCPMYKVHVPPYVDYRTVPVVCFFKHQQHQIRCSPEIVKSVLNFWLIKLYKAFCVTETLYQFRFLLIRTFWLPSNSFCVLFFVCLFCLFACCCCYCLLLCFFISLTVVHRFLSLCLRPDWWSVA